MKTLFEELDTPSLVVDRSILEANLERMGKLAASKGVKLRPHAKTHKCVEIGRMQLKYGANGLTLAKTSEAMTFADQGVDDIFLAYPVVGPAKLRRLVEISHKCRVTVGVDSLEEAAELNRAFESDRSILPVLLEVDTGLGRTGVGLEKVRSLAEAVARMSHLEIYGIYTFRGALLSEIQDFSDAGMKAAVEKQGRVEAEIMGNLAAELQRTGFNMKVVSAGSTPTARSVVSVPGVTEIRPGTYVFNDAMQVRLGACTWQDCAARVLVTVVSRPTPERAVIDGGSKVFAGDSKPDIAPLNLRGMATIVSPDGTPRNDILFERMNEEHGMLWLSETARDLKVGDRLWAIPNHICTTVNLFDNLTVVSSFDSKNHIEIWPVINRGKVQ